MHLAALLVAGNATMEGGAINATCLPTTSYDVDQIPLWLTVPVLVVVHAPRGDDYDPQLFVVCKDPGGTRRGTVRFAWGWPDQGDKQSKYRCFTEQFSFAIESEGEYTIGVYHDPDATREVGPPIPLSIALAGGSPMANNGAGS
ncbi:MAG: hypothetical protein JO236_07180 [Mycobacterium sp.]|uniref:hypothetical protein n=1 Tax=Mycobacterium sp. TaxID=1785 RepID=UPI001EC276C5|nr:hypothetical protein [Mycobacterium sp.]MBW0017309.1 hypothetical protein [Mycobacterium sp.]